MYKVVELNYSQGKFEKILKNLRESLIKYFVENVQHEDIKEADSWYQRIENVIKSGRDDCTSFEIRKEDDIIGFLIYRHINENFALIRHFYILDIVEREEVAFILLKQAIEKLKSVNENIRIDNAAFTFPEDYLANPLKRLGYGILKRHNMTLNVSTFDTTHELLSEYSFASFSERDLPEIAEFSVKAYKNHPDSSFWEEINSVPLYLEYLEKSLTTYFLKDCSFTVKDEKGQIKGLCLIEKGDEEDEIIIQNIAVQKKNQGKGIGKALLSKVLEVARKLGYNKAILTVTEGISAQKMYMEFGFKRYTSFYIITDD